MIKFKKFRLPRKIKKELKKGFKVEIKSFISSESTIDSVFIPKTKGKKTKWFHRTYNAYVKNAKEHLNKLHGEEIMLSYISHNYSEIIPNLMPINGSTS